jgi:hypothetical protein
MILIDKLMRTHLIPRLYLLVLLMMIKNVKENLSENLKMNLSLEMILVINILKEINKISYLFLMIMSQNIYLIQEKMLIWIIIGTLKIKE